MAVQHYRNKIPLAIIFKLCDSFNICVFLQLESQFSVELSLKRAEQRILSLYLITIRKSWSKPNLSTPEWRMATKIAKICHFEKKIVSFSKFQNQTTSQFLARISSKLYLILTSLNPCFLSLHLFISPSICHPPPPHLIKLSITQYHSTYFLVLFSITWYYLTYLASFSIT